MQVGEIWKLNTLRIRSGGAIWVLHTSDTLQLNIALIAYVGTWFPPIVDKPLIIGLKV